MKIQELKEISLKPCKGIIRTVEMLVYIHHTEFCGQHWGGSVCLEIFSLFP